MSEGGPSTLRFDDGKEASALRTIGEVARALNLRQHVLRYWEQQFPMLQPLKRSGGRRYYRPEDVAHHLRQPELPRPGQEDRQGRQGSGPEQEDGLLRRLQVAQDELRLLTFGQCLTA